MTIDKSHGSPYDRGAADAYYGRIANPHKWCDALGRLVEFCLTADEITAYYLGYDEQDDRKEYE